MNKRLLLIEKTGVITALLNADWGNNSKSISLLDSNKILVLGTSDSWKHPVRVAVIFPLNKIEEEKVGKIQMRHNYGNGDASIFFEDYRTSEKYNASIFIIKYEFDTKKMLNSLISDSFNNDILNISNTLEKQLKNDLYVT